MRMQCAERLVGGEAGKDKSGESRMAANRPQKEIEEEEGREKERHDAA